MIEINLLPEELRKKQVTRIALPELPVKKALITIGCAVAVLQIFTTVLAVWVTAENGFSRQQAAALTEQTRETIELKKKSSALQGRVREYEEISRLPFRWAALLSSLTEAMTKGVWLRSLQVEEIVVAAPAAPQAPEAPKKSGKAPKASERRAAAAKSMTVRVMKIEGSVMAPGQETAYVGKFLKSLKDNAEFSKIFADAELSNVTQRKIQTYEVYDFVISCRFRGTKAK
jgi:hypothetical protein